MGWIGCAHYEKFRHDFMARTFALIAPVQPVLHRLYNRNITIPNWPEHYETSQNISLGSYGLDQVCSLRKISTRLRGMTFCTSLARFAPSFVRQPKDHEITQIVRNAPKCQFRVQWGGSGVRCEKFRRNFVARTFALVRPVFHRVS